MIKLTYKEERDIRFYQEYKRKKSFKKLCLISHFSKNNKIDSYVVYMIKKMFEEEYDIVLVSTSKKLGLTEISKIKRYLKSIIVKNNRGYDFISWKTALSKVPDYKKYEQIIHMNDSIFFPLFPLKNMFNKMKKEKVDFWGLSDSYMVRYHIQSFFWVFNKKIIHSKFYSSFWNNCTAIDNKNLLIHTYEVGFTPLLIKNNFKVSAYMKIDTLYSYLMEHYKHLCPIQEYTPFYTFWNIGVVEFQMPYIKKNILLPDNISYNAYSFYWKSVINDNTEYNSKYISAYIEESSSENESDYYAFNQSVEIFKEFVSTQINKKKIIIYAYSHIGILLHSLLKNSVVSIVDQNYKSINNNASYNIKDPMTIQQTDYDSLLICAFGREAEVIKYLNEHGIFKNIYVMQMSPQKLQLFSANMTKLLKGLETINIENQNNQSSIYIYKTNNYLFRYLLTYNTFRGFAPLKILDKKEYYNSDKIMFHIEHKVKNMSKDVEFSPMLEYKQ